MDEQRLESLDHIEWDGRTFDLTPPFERFATRTRLPADVSCSASR